MCILNAFNGTINCLSSFHFSDEPKNAKIYTVCLLNVFNQTIFALMACLLSEFIARYSTWFDEEQMSGDIIEQMAKGIENSKVYITRNQLTLSSRHITFLFLFLITLPLF